MSPLRDPAIWMIVALVACMQATFLLGRRFEAKPKWSALWALAFAPLIGVGYAVKGNPTYTVWSFAVVLVCAVYLAVRINKPSLRWPVVAGACLTACFLASWGVGVAATPTYMSGPADWANTDPAANPYWALLDIRQHTVTDPVSGIQLPESLEDSGYLDRLPDSFVDASRRGPFIWSTPEPQWHTWLTGLSRRHDRKYRIWLPKGQVIYAADHARIVEIVDGRPPTVDFDGLPGRPLDGFEREMTGW
jgi:hypothetical protein